MTPIIRAYDAKLEVIAGERAVVAKINTDAVDRYRTVIDPAGMTLVNFRNNPVVLCNHGDANEGLPVGRCAWIKYVKAERAIVAKTIYFEDEFSDKLFRKAQEGVMNAYSVRIIPDMARCSSPTADEVRKRPELADCYFMFRASDLGEYSIVSVPGNPEALALAVSRGLILPDGFEPARTVPAPVSPPDPAEETAPDSAKLTGRTLAQASKAALDSLRRTLPSEARRATQERLDLLRGKV